MASWFCSASEPADTEAEVDLMANKVANLRVFGDGEGKFNLSVTDGRDGETERRRDGAQEFASLLYVSPSLCLSVSLSL